MGYQQSFIKFESEYDLIFELNKYKQRNTNNDMATVICVDRVKKAIEPFKKGELVLVVGGERYEQRNVINLKQGLGIDNVEEIVFVDNPEYWSLANRELGKFLDEYFEVLPEDEVNELLSVNKSKFIGGIIMEIGKTYEIKIDDCCVWGSFTSMLNHIEVDEDGDPKMYVFDNGVKIYGYGIANDAKEVL